MKAFSCASSVAGIGLAIACSSSSSPSTSSACDHYFTAVLMFSCSGPTLPSSEVTREQSRFEAVCAAALALPGSGLTASTLDACASAVQGIGCSGVSGPITACDLAGTLAGGSECSDSLQCQSDECDIAGSGSSSPDGGDSSTFCGTCSPAAANGQRCGGDAGVCGEMSTCSNATTTCVPITYGAAGASCAGTGGTQCNAGLYCDPGSMKCTALLSEGSTCTEEGACTRPLVCVMSSTGTGTGKCQSPGSSGAMCGNDEDCASGLGCSTGTHTCGAVTWADSGKACGDLTRCLVGSCPFQGSTGGTGGVCATVIADGQPCSSSSATETCDSYAECLNGTCVLVDTQVCK
jgi:hypothetical protein